MPHDLLHAFPSQEHNEPVFVFARPFWFAFIPTLLIYLLVFGGTVAGQFYTSSLPGNLAASTANIIILALGVFQLLALVVFFVAILDFYFDVIIVTDRRLVDIDQEQLFYRKVSELNLRDVQDTSFDRKGFFQTFLNYGSVTIQTAGERTNFVIDNLRHPSEIAMLISDLADQAKDGVPEEKRFPEGSIVGVIEGQIITDPAGLILMGAMLPEDARRERDNH